MATFSPLTFTLDDSSGSPSPIRTEGGQEQHDYVFSLHPHMPSSWPERLGALAVRAGLDPELFQATETHLTVRCEPSFVTKKNMEKVFGVAQQAWEEDFAKHRSTEWARYKSELNRKDRISALHAVLPVPF